MLLIFYFLRYPIELIKNEEFHIQFNQCILRSLLLYLIHQTKNRKENKRKKE